jgi:hypothetical protein
MNNNFFKIKNFHLGLYVVLAVYWIIGILKSEHWKSATYISIIFMGGSAFGRMISIIIDGIPSLAFSIGTVLEIWLMIWGIRNLKVDYILKEN